MFSAQAAQANGIPVANPGMSQPVVIMGAGGHALSIADAARCAGHQVIGCIAPEAAARTRGALAWLGDETALADPTLQHCRLINGVGSAATVRARRHLYLRLRADGREFASIIHPRAGIAELDCQHGDALQLLAAATLGPGTRIGDNVLVNTAATVEHGCAIGSHSHVASGAVICGDCRIGDSVHVGAGAVLIQGITVGDGAVIAAGAVVTRNVEPLTLVAGVPARRIRKLDEQELA